MITRERRVNFVHRGRSRSEASNGQAPVTSQAGRVPRISRLMALAIYLDQLVKDGIVSDQAELARLGHVSRARLTQIMNLLLLAPDIQEALLFLPATALGRDSVRERELRPIAGLLDWCKQRCAWGLIATDVNDSKTIEFLGLVDGQASN